MIQKEDTISDIESAMINNSQIYTHEKKKERMEIDDSQNIEARHSIDIHIH
jgi:hypothetical protein